MTYETERNVDLMIYLPSMMKRYKEITKVMEAENPEFNLIWKANALIKQNLYIITAQEEGLKRYERIPGIFPSPEDDFESRRSRIITRWNDITPYTLRYLIGILTVLTNGNFELRTNFTEYEIEIIVTLTTSGAVDDLAYIFKHIMPCNLTILSKNNVHVNAIGDMRFAAALKYTVTYFITNDLNAKYTANGTLYGGSTLVHSNSLFATNDFETGYSADGEVKTASTLVQSTVKLITNDFDTKYTASGKINSGSNLGVVSHKRINGGNSFVVIQNNI